MSSTPRDQGIPFFCCKCGSRIEWTMQEHDEENAQVYSEDCAEEAI